MKAEETVDELRRYGLRLIQPRDGYRFSLDPLLLCAFASRRTAETAIDLGTGCGVMPLVLARRYGVSRVVGVESQQQMAALAERNVALNALEGRVTIVADDVLQLRRRFPVSSFDLVVSNPPYRRRGTGRVSPRPGRDLARHESSAGLADFLAAAKYLVRPGGSICFIYHPSRLDEFVACGRELKLSLARLRMVHGTLAAEARMFMAELVKGRRGEPVVEPPLVIYGDDGGYLPEAGEILGG